MQSCRSRMKFLKTIFVLAFGCYCLFTSKLFAAGVSTAEFLGIIPVPQSIAMGEGVFSNSYSPGIMMSNPAETVFIYQPAFSLSEMVFVEGIRYHFAAVSVPSNWGNVGGAVSYLTYGDIPGFDYQGNAYSISSSKDLAFTLNYSLPLRKRIPVIKDYGSVGVNVKFIQSTLTDYATEGIALDVGTIVTVPYVDGLDAALVYRNLGSNMKFVDDSNFIPSLLDFGLRYKGLKWNDLTFVADIRNDIRNSQTTYSGGLSLSPITSVVFRTGWKETTKTLDSGLRMGVGMDFGGINLNYSISPFKDFDMIHTIGVDVAFGNVFQPRIAYEQYLKKYFQEARDKYNKKDYIGSRQQLEEILSIYPDDKLSKEYLQKISEALDKMEQQAASEINKWSRKARVAFSRNDLLKAKKYYNYVLVLDPENTNALDGLNKVEKALNDLKLEKARIDNQKKITSIWKLAREFYVKGDFVNAKERFEEILLIDPENSEAKKYILDVDNKISIVSAKQIEDLFAKGMEFYKEGKYQDAKKYFEAVSLAAPYRIDAAEYVNRCNQQIKELDQKTKIEIVAREQGRMKKEMESIYDKSLKAYDKGEFESALINFNKSQEVAVHYEFKEYLENIKSYIALTKTALAERHYRAGVYQYQKNRFESAAAEFRKALDYEPNNPLAKTELEKISENLSQQYYEQGMNEFASGELEKAKESFKKSLLYKPNKEESKKALDRIK